MLVPEKQDLASALEARRQFEMLCEVDETCVFRTESGLLLQQADAPSRLYAPLKGLKERRQTEQGMISETAKCGNELMLSVLEI